MAARRGERLLDALRDQRESEASSFLHNNDPFQTSDGAIDALSVEESSSRVVEWLIWTLASSIPIFGAGAWLTIALRRRRPGLLYEAVIAAFWPAIALLVVFLASVVFGFVDALLFLQFDSEWEKYYLEAQQLIGNHPQYAWVGNSQQLGGIDSMQFMFEQLNQGMDRLVAFQQLATTVLIVVLPAMWAASIFHAQRQWFRDFESNYHRRERRPDERPEKLMVSIVALWTLFGWLGAHRYYVGRWISGLLYTFSFGGLGVAWAVDAFFLRSSVAEANAEPPRPMDLAPWSGETRFGVVDFIARFLFFAIAPAAYVALCVLFSQFELLFVLILTLIVCGLFGNLHESIGRLKILEHAPFIRTTVGVVKEMYQFYFTTPPRSFLFYVLGPVFAPGELLKSRLFRQETKLYLRLLGAILGAVVINQIRLVPTTYRFHSYDSIALWMLVHVVAALAVSWLVLPPIVTTTFAYNLSGRLRRLRVLSISALVVSCVIGLTFFGLSYIREAPTLVSYQLISRRLEDETMQKRLTQSTRLFLEHYVPKSPKPLEDFYPMASHPRLTHRYQEEVLSVMIPASEAKVFQVFTMDVEGDEPDGAWVGVGIYLSEIDEVGWRTLFLMGPDGKLYSTWDEDIPPRVADDFELASALWNAQYEHRIARRTPEIDARLYDQSEQFLRKRQADMKSDASLWRVAAQRLEPAKEGEAPSPVFDPAATHLLRRQLINEWGDDALRFRVFLLPPPDLGRHQWGWWLGVCDGQEPLCVLAPWGDCFRAWDSEIFARFRRVTMQFDVLTDARKNPGTKELLSDIQMQRASEFLERNIRSDDSDEVLSKRIGLYVDRESRAKAIWTVRSFELQGSRWLSAVEGGRTRYVMGSEERLYVRGPGGRFQDLAGRNPPFSPSRQARSIGHRPASSDDPTSLR